VQRGFKEDNWGNRVSSIRESAKKKGAAIQEGIEPGSRGIAIVRSRYQATSSEVVEIAIAILLFVVTTCKWSVNPLSNPKPV
jgi:hypothetical protein